MCCTVTLPEVLDSWEEPVSILMRITVYPVMTPFWSIKSGGSHCTSIDVEERIVIWIVFGVPDGSGEARSNRADNFFWHGNVLQT